VPPSLDCPIQIETKEFGVLMLDSLDKRIPVLEEITALKLRITDIEKRLAMA
jgi:hypothetical protein